MASSSRTSFSMSPNALPSAARKQTEPVPVGTRFIPASSVIAAVGRENSSSRFGWAGLVRPRIVSRKPTALPAQLVGDLRQLAQPAVQRRVRGEDVGQVELLAARLERGDEVEGVQRLGGPPTICWGPDA